MASRLVRIVAIVTLSGVLLGCSPSAIASVLPVAAGPLVTMTTRGGECPEGMCGSAVVIERDGRVHRNAPDPAELGTVPPTVLATLDTLVRTADFDAIRARPFTGTCPMAYDGQEVVYEFGAPGGTQRVASCETEIDPNQPVFAAVTVALRGVAVQPVS
jgi:hypothetical protein